MENHFDNTIQLVNNRMKDCILVNEFKQMFEQVTEQLKLQETNLMDKTANLETAISMVKLDLGNQPRSTSPNSSRTNTYLVNELGAMKEEIRNIQGRVQERTFNDTNEIKSEIFNKINEEIGNMIQQEVNTQCDIQARNREVKQQKLTHEESHHEDLLAHLLKTSGEAHNQVTTLESRFPRLEARVQTLDNMQLHVSNLETQIQGLMKKVS